MWLINVTTFQLKEFTSSIPPYATFSHVTEQNETSFQDMAHTEQGTTKESLHILQRACDEARNAGSEWLWNFAACVDKRSSAAQSEAINSLGQIYRDCEYSIIYLEDLKFKLVADDATGERLAGCRWAKNIWAIPQIIFPRVAYLYSSDWNQIGTKRSLIPLLSSIIGIDKPVLEDSDCLEDYSIARRMSWASHMSASRIEDFAYALLGLFDISMSILYGEGGKSFLRLQEKILRDTDDYSLLAWDTLDDQEYTGLFAHSPDWFHRFRSVPITQLRINGESQIHCAGITIETTLCREQGNLFLPLEAQDGSNCWIPLFEWNGYFVRKGGRVEWELSKSISLERRRICIKRDVTAHVSRKISGSERVVVADLLRSLELPDIGLARTSRCSIMGYNSNNRMSSKKPSADALGTTYQYAPSTSFSEPASHENPIVWSDQERSLVRGTLSALGGDVRPSSVHSTTSEAQCLPEDCVISDAENHCLCSDSACTADETGPLDLKNSNGSPPTGDQILDVAHVSKELADIAIKEYLNSHQRKPSKRSFVPWLNQTRKRPKLTKSSEHLEVVQTSDFDDGETVLVNKARFFACPFYVRNKKYTKCMTRHHLRSIEDVKDHLLWEHRQPIFCPLCKEEFPSGRIRDVHLRLRSCHLNTSNTPEGITDEQDDRLNREEETSLPEELRWFQVWNIIFPEIEHPPSPFYTDERELSVCAFRQFWMQSGEDIVATFLQKRECQSYSIQNEERRLQAIYDLVVENVVDRIFVDFSD